MTRVTPSKKQLQRYPEINDLAKQAKRRIPHVAWEYLSTGTGDEKGRERNLEKMAEVTLLPTFLKGELKPDLSTSLLGKDYAAPFGVAPVGLGGLIWPKVENYLALAANHYKIPYCLSTVATQTPEVIGPLVGDMGWFQLYAPNEKDLRQDILKRAEAAGFNTLVVTADVPTPSRRERMQRAGLVMPPKITPDFVMQGILNPRWTIETLIEGIPNLKTLEPYMKQEGITEASAFRKAKIGRTLSWDYLQETRDEWQGQLVIKGLLHPDDALKALELGVDAIQVSNHGGRQFNGGPAAIEALPDMVKTINHKVPVLFDGGVRSGLDIIRALALGADFVFLGRAFIYGVAALGESGGAHVTELLIDDLKNNMINLGVSTMAEVKALQPRA